MTHFVAYYRVSTERQGRSGLGLDAQRSMIADYVASIGGSVCEAFTEIESGKSHLNRPMLQKALGVARKRKATLIVAKLDRLARNVAFVSSLLESGVEFQAADFPTASRMMLQQLAIFAEYEREQISARTKAALAARKAKGLPLGRPQNLVGSPMPRINREHAKAVAERMRPIVDSIRGKGVCSLKGITDSLNQQGYLTENGNQWHLTTVKRLISRL
jgi:DNA invertase Pin-like site-specific DNA recombinase